MDVLLVRHAHDRCGADGSRTLSPLGHAQASALADWLAGTGAEGIWTSTSGRAGQTAAILARALGLRPRADPRIDEIGHDRPPAVGAAPPRERPRAPDLPGSEGWEAFLDRVSAFFGELAEEPLRDGRIVVVTHSGVFDAVHEVITGAGRRVEVEIAHTGVTVWRHRPGSPAGTWLLRRHNDTPHLDAAPRLRGEVNR